MNDCSQLKPQLVMWRASLNALPDLIVPDGYTMRSSRPEDGVQWAAIINAAFGTDHWTPAKYEQSMINHPAYRPERILFVCAPDGVPCATGSAYRDPKFGERTGYVHMVGVHPAQAGKKLGYVVSLAVLYRLRDAGCENAVLHTDDYRLPAIKTYLRLGFQPRIIHENQPERWNVVLRKLGWPVPRSYAGFNGSDGLTPQA